MDLKGKVVLITGGGGGIGAGLAEAFLERGAKVAVTDVNREYAEAEGKRLGAMSIEHDVTSLDSWRQVRDAVQDNLGPVDVLCNNAGVSQPFKPLDEVTPEQFARILAINVTGVYNGVLTFVPEMKARK
jgi:NAD(P)-dependent dehydrogenase (short-subunit alcohol dehydrogenase family)